MVADHCGVETCDQEHCIFSTTTTCSYPSNTVSNKTTYSLNKMSNNINIDIHIMFIYSIILNTDDHNECQTLFNPLRLAKMENG